MIWNGPPTPPTHWSTRRDYRSVGKKHGLYFKSAMELWNIASQLLWPIPRRTKLIWGGSQTDRGILLNRIMHFLGGIPYKKDGIQHVCIKQQLLYLNIKTFGLWPIFTKISPLRFMLLARWIRLIKFVAKIDPLLALFFPKYFWTPTASLIFTNLPCLC